MGTQKNRLNETVPLSTQNACSNRWVRKQLKVYANKISLSGSMNSYTKHNGLGTQKNRLNETVPLSTQNTCLN